MFDLSTVVHAEAAATGAAPMPAGGGTFTLVWLVLMIAMFYFMLIRPQKKQEKKMREMLAALQVGDKVVTAGGICGKITKIKDDVIFLETGSTGNPAERSILKLERAAIKTVQTIHE